MYQIIKPMNDSLGLAIVMLTVLLSACTTIPPARPGPVSAHPQQFSHSDFDGVLKQFVNRNGRVDYSGLKAKPGQFERYYQQVAAYSPDNSPALFATPSDRLAYWINAYNAAVIKTVLNYYPIDSIEDVKPPLPLFFLPDKAGFFLFQKPVFGQATSSLYYLENSVIRDRFMEPRIHFALNCASHGCPQLPRYAFDGDELDQQLDHETRKFFAEKRNFTIDHAQKTIYLSSILDWYRDDFIAWVREYDPQQEATLINYIALYLNDEQAQFVRTQGSAYALEFVPYDWRLNGQNQI